MKWRLPLKFEGHPSHPTEVRSRPEEREVPRFHAKVLSGERFIQAESPRVDPRNGELMWVDMEAAVLYTGCLQSGKFVTTRAVRVGSALGAAAPMATLGAGWVAGSGRDLVHVSEEGVVSALLPDLTPSSAHSLNDGICGVDGAFWIGSQVQPRVPDGALYRIGADLVATRVLERVTVSNGIAFDPTGSVLHYIDTLPDRCLETFDVIGATLTNRRSRFRFPRGNPDGIALDSDGHVWVALWDAGEVWRISPSGQLSAIVEVPVSRPTAVALWQGLLVITTAVYPDEEMSGRIFAAAVPFRAPATRGFAGLLPHDSHRSSE